MILDDSIGELVLGKVKRVSKIKMIISLKLN